MSTCQGRGAHEPWCACGGQRTTRGSRFSLSTQIGSKLLSHLTTSLAPLRSSQSKNDIIPNAILLKDLCVHPGKSTKDLDFLTGFSDFSVALRLSASQALVPKYRMVRAWQAGISMPFRPMKSSSAVGGPSTTQPLNQLFYFSDDSQKTMQVSVGNSSWVTPRPEFLSHLGCSTSISMKSQQVQNGKGPKEHLIQSSHFPRSKLIPSWAKAFTLPLSMFQMDTSEIQMESLGQECSSEVKLAQHEQALGSTSSTTNMNTQLVTQF